MAYQINTATPSWTTHLTMEKGSEFVSIGDITSVNYPQLSAAEIEVTHSLSEALEFISGRKDWGTVTATLNFDPASTATADLYAAVGSTKSFKIVDDGTTTTPGVTYAFAAAVTSFAPNASAEGSPNSATLTLRVSGNVTITVGG